MVLVGYLMIVVSPMGNSMWCFIIKSKAFELVVDGASTVLQILDQSRGIVCSIRLVKVSVAWRIHPLQIADSLSKKNCANLDKCIKEVGDCSLFLEYFLAI